MGMIVRRSLVLAVLLAAVGFSAAPAHAADPVLIAAGDIASCSSLGDEATAVLLGSLEGTIVTLGDNAYESGTTTEFNNCYNPTWGQFKTNTRPAAGNHEYNTPGATGYYGYFGAAAGDPAKGYYSYDLGTWHIVVINSNCSAIGGCGAGSLQDAWLRADLAAHPVACTLAYWHHPLFSSSLHGNQTYMRPIWQALYEGGADVVLSGHDHSYERFGAQLPDGTADAARGLREFVVGTGGRSHYAIGTPIANSEAHNDDTYGVLKMTLHPSGYDWQFVPVAGGTFADTGSATCHAAPSAPQPSVSGVAAEPSGGANGGELAPGASHGSEDAVIWIGVAAGIAGLVGACALAILRLRRKPGPP